MILNDVITEVRRLLQDETATFRYSDTFLLALCNQTLKRIAILRPDLFALTSTITCVQSTVVQTIPTDGIRLIEVYSVVGGNALVETNREVLDQTIPAWVSDSEAAAQNWMRNVRNPYKFFIYPKAPAAQVLNLEYAQTPPDYTGTATVALLPDGFFPVVVDGTMWLAESIDNEHVTAGRAALFQQSFTSQLQVSLQSRSVTDTETGGLEREEVI